MGVGRLRDIESKLTLVVRGAAWGGGCGDPKCPGLAFRNTASPTPGSRHTPPPPPLRGVCGGGFLGIFLYFWDFQIIFGIFGIFKLFLGIFGFWGKNPKIPKNDFWVFLCLPTPRHTPGILPGAYFWVFFECITLFATQKSNIKMAPAYSRNAFSNPKIKHKNTQK